METKDISQKPERITCQAQGWDALAAAIIEQAIKDYRLAIIVGHETKIKKLERFFRSTYFNTISMLDPEWLIKNCKEQFTKERDEKNEKKRKRAEKKLAEF